MMRQAEADAEGAHVLTSAQDKELRYFATVVGKAMRDVSAALRITGMPGHLALNASAVAMVRAAADVACDNARSVFGRDPSPEFWADTCAVAYALADAEARADPALLDSVRDGVLAAIKGGRPA